MKKPDKKRRQPRSAEPPRQRALARWEAEGGAELVPALPTDAAEEAGDEVQVAANPSLGSASVAPGSDAESLRLHDRLMALENLVVSLLAMGNKRQLALARHMAGQVVPVTNPSSIRLTEQAARQMADMVGRAQQFRERT